MENKLNLITYFKLKLEADEPIIDTFDNMSRTNLEKCPLYKAQDETFRALLEENNNRSWNDMMEGGIPEIIRRLPDTVTDDEVLYCILNFAQSIGTARDMSRPTEGCNCPSCRLKRDRNDG